LTILPFMTVTRTCALPWRVATASPVAAPGLLPLWDKDVVGAGATLLAAFFIDAVASCVAGRWQVKDLST
jgi:hypothetical protein